MTKKKAVKKDEVVVEEVVESTPEPVVEKVEKPKVEEVAEPFGGGPFTQD